MTLYHSNLSGRLSEASNYIELQVFVAVVEAGTFAGAARRLKLSPPSISRHISGLEARLQVKLIQRSTHSLAVTETGASFYEKVRGILQDIEVAEEQVSGDIAEPRGWLRASMPAAVAVRFLRPRLGEFMQLHPELAVELMLTSRRYDLLREGIDVAIVWSNEQSINAPPEFTATPIARIKIGAYAAPAYIEKHGLPETPADLLSHNCLFGRSDTINERWPVQSNGKVEFIRVKGNLVIDNPDILLDAARYGLGIALLPARFALDALQKGEVVSLLDEHWAQIHRVYAIVPDRAYLPKKVRLFIDFVKFCMGTEED